MAAIESLFDVQFGILNLKGLMTTKNNVVELPIFAHSTYPITTTLDPAYSKSFGVLSYHDKKANATFEGKNYQKLYRKVVRWNFGDGTEVEGFSAKHYYDLPGKYTITCTFFDINRQGVLNGFKLQVIVKQVIPTVLIFDKTQSSLETLSCSKIEKIAKVEALLSNNVKNNVDIIAKRVYQENEQKEDTWDDVKGLDFPHFRKYQTFLARDIEYYYNTRSVYKEKFTPTETYSPEYEDLYGYFALQNNQIVFRCYRVQPYANVAAMPNIQINNPNVSILNTESFSSYTVTDVSTMSELPEEAQYVGKRAFVDIFYRSDFISAKNTVFISFDIDQINVHNSISASTNFLNIPPLGLHFKVAANNFNNVNFSCTLNGFLTSYELIDKLVQLSFVKDYTFNTLLVPYFRSEYNEYYIPKDFNFTGYTLTITNNSGNNSTVNQLTNQLPFLRSFSIKCGTRINTTLKIAQGTTTKANIVFNYSIKDLDSVVIPTEKYYNQNVKELIDVYTPHEMFKDTPILKQTLVDVFENGKFLDYVLTKGINFFDDVVNVKTNYVASLLNTIHMMGKDAYEYDQTSFEGVNELRDLCRILSMNHSELVGNLIDEHFDIKYTESYKGEHIGDEILVTDEIYTYPNNLTTGPNRFQKGKIIKVKRNGNLVSLKEPTLLIYRDNYTNETKIVNFADVEPTRTESGLNVYQIKNYKPSWRWGLLLPDKEDKDGKILESYYSFYLLIQPRHNVRVGNYLEEDTITSETETKASWEEIDGKTFDKIQKIIHKALDV